MAVLVGVFAPLDLFVQSKPLTLRYAFGTMAIFVVLFVIGVALEVMFRWKD